MWPAYTFYEDFGNRQDRTRTLDIPPKKNFFSQGLTTISSQPAGPFKDQATSATVPSAGPRTTDYTESRNTRREKKKKKKKKEKKSDTKSLERCATTTLAVVNARAT